MRARVCTCVPVSFFFFFFFLLWRAEIGVNDDASVKTPTCPDSLVNI